MPERGAAISSTTNVTAARDSAAARSDDGPALGLREALLGHRQVSVPLAAAAVIGVLTLIRTVAAGRGWFSNDDLGWQGVAASHRLPDGTLLSTSWNNHLQPVEWVVIWVFTHAAPLRFWPVIVSTAVLLLAHGGSTYLLLRRLFGSRPEIVPLVALATGSSLTLAASLWWAVQLVQLPLLVLSTLTVWAFLGYLQRRGRRDLLGTAALLGAALLVSERAVLLPVLLLVLQVGWFSGEGTLVRRTWRALRFGLPVWLSLGLVAGTYAAWYVATVPSAAASTGTPKLFVDVGWEATLHSLAPALIGGPWTWLPIDDVANVAEPGRPTRLAAVLVLVGLIAWSCATRRYAARAWALLLLFVLVGSALLTGTRAPLIGPISGREYRYFTELALVGPLALGLALLPVRWQVARGGTVVLQPRPRPAALTAATADWAPLGDLLRRRSTALTALVTTSFLVASAISTARYDDNWSSNSARTWMTTAQSELRLHPEARVADTSVPAAVVPPVAGFYTRTAVLLRPVTSAGRFLTHGSAGEELRALGPTGRLAPVTIIGVGSVAGPVQGCGWRAAGAPVTVPLLASTPNGHPLVRIAYFTGQDGVAELTAGRSSTDVVLRQGLHVVYLAADGPLDSVTVSGVPRSAPVCITDVQAGEAQAAS